jgi:general secretion pathway protein C
MIMAERAGWTLAALIGLASVVWASIPVARHMAGVVVLETTPAPARPATPPQMPDISALSRVALFGRPAGTEPAATRRTRPDVTLRGIFASEPGASTALLEVAGETGLYRETMRVADTLEVIEIAPDLVRLADDAGVVTLRFDAVAEVATAAPDNDTQADLLARITGTLVTPARYERPEKPETTSQYIDYWRHRIRKNPQAVLDEIGLKATDAGYVIADRHDVGVRLAGLQSGDLVRMVNGQPVGDPNTDRRLYDQIAASGIARLEVERGGQTLSFSFPLR